jgi:hypothetical protein
VTIGYHPTSGALLARAEAAARADGLRRRANASEALALFGVDGGGVL